MNYALIDKDDDDATGQGSEISAQPCLRTRLIQYGAFPESKGYQDTVSSMLIRYQNISLPGSRFGQIR